MGMNDCPGKKLEAALVALEEAIPEGTEGVAPWQRLFLFRLTRGRSLVDIKRLLHIYLDEGGIPPFKGERLGKVLVEI
jgi:hypothetical protein